jgi:very-short-patch-repair endonuclease
LVYKKLNLGVIEKEVRVAIVCDGYDFNNKKEQVTKDSIITRRLMANGWKVIRYTGAEIYRTNKSDEIESLLDEIKKIVQS